MYIRNFFFTEYYNNLAIVLLLHYILCNNNFSIGGINIFSEFRSKYPYPKCTR